MKTRRDLESWFRRRKKILRAPEEIMIKNKPHILTLAPLIILLCAPVAFAQSSPKATNTQDTAKKTTSTTRMMSDTQFAKDAAEGGMAEVKLGQLAEQKGTVPSVKDFGKRMVTDHSKADDELKTATSNDKITLPSQMSAKDQSVYDRLAKLSGKAFDRAYAQDMVRDHSADVALFHMEAKDGKNTSIKSFASQTLPTLEDHLKQAQEMLHGLSTTKSS